MATDQQLLDALHEARVLGIFKSFCEKHNSLSELTRLRNIYSQSNNPGKTTRALLEFDNASENWEEPEINRFYQLITAFLKKSPFRKQIDDFQRRALLVEQQNKCAICDSDIDIKAHADHIVPFKYVGDELDNNLQMLCEDCNRKKSASIDYQIRHLLKLV